MKVRHYVATALMLAAFCLFSLTRPVFAAENPEGVVADGVMVEGIELSGMTKEEAEEVVAEYFEGFKTGSLLLSFNGSETEITFEELGITWDNPNLVEEAMSHGKSGNVLQRYKETTRLRKEGLVLDLEYSLDEELLEAYLIAEADARKTDPVDATIARSGKKFKTTESVTGLTVDVPATMAKIHDMVQNQWNGGCLAVEAVVEVTEPRVSTEDVLLITDKLGDYSTPYNAASISRTQNLTNGTGFINGDILMPGESLSMYEQLYPCTEANGYASAIAYADGGYVDSVGGGICQIATTLYNALLKSELKVTKRYPHSMTVSYVPPGWDAALSSGYKDLEFLNSTDYPVYVEAWAKNGELYICLWGKETRPDNREVSYYEEIISQTPPGDPIVTEDPTLPLGEMVEDQSAYDAIKVVLYKQVKVDGKVVETIKLHTDNYKSSPAKIRVGTGPAAEGGTTEGQ